MTFSIFSTFPPKVSQWTMQLKFWNCRGGDWVLNFSFPLAATSAPLSNYGRNQMNCKWNKFSPEHFHFINTCFRLWEHIRSIVSFMEVISNYYFLLKKRDLPNYTQRNTKESGLEYSVPISRKQKFSKIDWIMFTLDISFTLLINRGFFIWLTVSAISHCFENTLNWPFWQNMSNIITIEEQYNNFHNLVVYFTSTIYILFQNLQEWCLCTFSVCTYRRTRSWHLNHGLSSVEKHLKWTRLSHALKDNSLRCFAEEKGGIPMHKHK